MTVEHRVNCGLFLHATPNNNEDLILFKPNYSYEKRQKEMAKKKKKEEKMQRKLEKQNKPVEENENTAPPEE
jgi:hypothetical protein